MAEDPLLSVHAVARELGISPRTIARLIENGRLTTLDRGVLASEGKFDVPVVRLSVVEKVCASLEVPGGLVHEESSERTLKAVEVAIGFHFAAQIGDGDALANIVRTAKLGINTPAELGEWCKTFVNGQFTEETGVTSGLRQLAPLGDLAALVVDDALAIPRVFTRTTPTTLIAVIPLVELEDEWFVDLDLFARQDELMDLALGHSAGEAEV